MNKDNPLVLAILQHLQIAEASFSLYELMGILERSGYELIQVDGDLSNDMVIFRKNFIVMNALYQLKSDLVGTGYQLIVSSLKINLITENTQLSSEQISLLDNDVATQEALSQYYLNWDHYHSTNDNDVADLLHNFWRNYSQYNERSNAIDKRLDSLQVLGLESDVSWNDIQQTYRQLITIYHPDKGGDSLKFIRIREAYLVLKLMLNTSQ